MKIPKPFWLFLVTLLSYGAGAATQPTSTAPTTQHSSLAPDDFDFKAMLGDPPADGSPQQQQEIEVMLNLQEHRTAEEVARCQSEVGSSPFDIGAAIVGAWFQAKDLPLTFDLLVDATRKGGIIGSAAKLNWSRKRPYKSDERLKPCVRLEPTFSYPSGHATRGMLWALILAELFPDHRDALLARGRQFGTDRTLAGVHYPTDVIAAQKLAAEIARRLVADPDFHAKLEKAKDECHAAAK